MNETEIKFLKKYATQIVRVSNKPKLFHKTSQEMDGKYGWFDSTYKDYNMTEYYSGWKFRSQKKLILFVGFQNLYEEGCNYLHHKNLEINYEAGWMGVDCKAGEEEYLETIKDLVKYDLTLTESGYNKLN